MPILVVDDDHVFAGLICDALQMSGHEARAVPTTESAIGALLERRYDVLLLDLDLGATRGEAMIRRFRSLGERLPAIIILSGQPAEVLEAAVAATGAVAAVRKPCAIDELLTAIAFATRPAAQAPQRA
jgi:DNA-binding response OmpR family regulator